MRRSTLLALLAVCSPASLLRAQGTPVELAWTGADSAIAQRGEWRGREALRATLPLTFRVLGAPALTDIRLELRPAGPIAVVNEAELALPGAGELPEEVPVEVEVSPGERAVLTATLHARAEDGRAVTRESALYIVAEGGTLYLSRASFTTVDLKRLQAALDAGRITGPVFEEGVRALLVHASAPAAPEPR